MNIIIENAQKHQAGIIAKMIMEAMNHECCQWFAGPEHTLEDFHQLMTRLVEMENSQYSYKNILTAKNDCGKIVGICVSYDGADLHTLRKAFIEEALKAFGRDHSNIPDETKAGELYIDSLCVRKDYRKMGIATKLLKATIEKGRTMGLPTGLLVDKGNPNAEKLYNQVGFKYVGDNEWGGHPMRHLVHSL